MHLNRLIMHTIHTEQVFCVFNGVGCTFPCCFFSHFVLIELNFFVKENICRIVSLFISLFKLISFRLSIADGSEKLSDTSPGAASISSVDIANEFASLSSEEQDRVRAEWSQVSKYTQT